MSERKKPTTRFQGERQPKRKLSPSPPPPPKAKRKSASPVPVVVPVEEVLPTKLTDGGPLPTSTTPQGDSDQFQSIAESGILAASLDRSRQRWLADGMFEKYWTKPTKKKGQPDVQNPAKESMLKLGSCSLVIEPHLFDVTLYSVKSNAFTFLAPMSQPPVQVPVPSYGVPSSTPIPNPQVPFYPPAQAPIPPSPSGFGPPVGYQKATLPTHSPAPPSHPSTTKPPSPKPAISSPDPNSNATKPVKDTNTDPVIQMLAARAATDQDLKALMKVVAMGHASQDQLKIFQSHIDDLNRIIKAQKDEALSAAGGHPSNYAIDGTSTNSSSTTVPPAPAVPTYAPPSQPIPFQPPPSLPSQYYSQPPQYIKAKGPIPPKQDISGAVFEFNSNTGDRYHLPKDSIVEYLMEGTHALMSFLITRRADPEIDVVGKEGKEYYQPVTIRLSAHHAKVLEPLARAVNRPDDVRKAMSEVMARATRADNVFLATKLARPSGEDSQQVTEAATEAKEDTTETAFEAPNSLLPL